MFHRSSSRFAKHYTYLLAALAVFLVLGIVLHPSAAFDASLHGLTIWWNIIFPSLLPFLILSEIWIAYGLLYFLGVWLEPFMKLLFRLPGASGPVLLMGLTVGYPSAASLTGRLRNERRLTQNEGELLLALSHMASPVLILYVIAVGFLQNTPLGFTLIIIHNLSGIIMGMIMSLFLLSSPRQDKLPKKQTIGRWRQAMLAMEQARQQDGRTFGRILSDAVSSSIQLLLMVGGTMMIFSVMLQLITDTAIFRILYDNLIHIIPDGMIKTILPAIFEVHLGAYSASQMDNLSAATIVAIVSGGLAWSGLSLHAQVKGITASSDLRYSQFLKARLLHCFIAVWITFLLWKPLHYLQSTLLQMERSWTAMTYTSITTQSMHTWTWWSFWGGTIIWTGLLLTLMLFLSALVIAANQWIKRMKR